MSFVHTAKTWGTEPLLDDDLNDEIKAMSDGIQAGWDTYTPSWTNTGTAPSLGNGTIAGRYHQVGKSIDFRISVQMGSTTTFGTGFFLFSLPFLLDWNDWDPIGNGTCWNDSSSDPYGFTAMYDDSGFARLVGSDGTKVGPTTPFTFATADRIIIVGRGELP